MEPADPNRERRRRAAERRRRVAKRRRNALGLLALCGFAAGLVVGSGGGETERGGRAANLPLSAGTAGFETVATVTGFADPVPILMYHAIGTAPAGAAMPELFVPEPELADQVKWLAKRGYHAVTLGQVFAAWNEDAPIPPKPVVLSFDDGLRSQYTGAFPHLRRLGWPGVLNLKAESLDQGEMTPPMVREMLAAGWELGSHTVTHADLAELDGEALEAEVAGSREQLSDRFGVEVDFLCYPGGSFDDEVIAAAKDAGYVGATTTEEGLAEPSRPFELARIRIGPGDGIEGLREKLAAAQAGAG